MSFDKDYYNTPSDLDEFLAGKVYFDGRGLSNQDLIDLVSFAEKNTVEITHLDISNNNFYIK